MYYLYDQKRNQYVTAAISLRSRGGGYAVYYKGKPDGARWATEKGAQACIDRLVQTGAIPADHALVIVKEER